MRILFLTDNFPPEVNAPATRTFEHCKEWVKNGVDVTIITCAPNFPQGKVYEGYKNKLYQTEYVEGIKVIRVWSYMTANKGTVKRTLDYISFMISSFLAGLFLKTDLIVATSPQFFTAISGSLLGFFKRKKWIMEVRDIWPESIKAVGAVADSPIIRVFEWLEKRMYASASKIVIVTHGLKRQLVEHHGIAADKIEVVTNGINPSSLVHTKSKEAFAKELGLEGKTIIGYIGTHGMAHGLDFVLKSASKIKQANIHFLLVGDGAKREELLSLKEELNLTNVTMLPSVGKSEVANFYELIDIGLVNLIKSDLFLSAIPSKLFELAHFQIPILLGVEGESKAIIEKYSAGVGFEPENEADFLLKIDYLSNNLDEFNEGSSAMAADYLRSNLAAIMLDFISK